MARHPMRFTAVRFTAAALAIAAAATGLAATPAQAANSFKCVYTFSPWTGGFVADLSITNLGPADVNGWLAHWTFNEPTANVFGWQAQLTVANNRDLFAKDAGYNAV